MHELCVVFDIDDTLYLERDYVGSGFRAVGRLAQDRWGLPGLERRCRDLFDAGVRGDIFDRVLPEKPEVVKGLVSAYRTHPPEIVLASDALDAIESISSRWPIAVISDGPPESQRRKADALGLCRISDTILLTWELGAEFHKPGTAAFAAVAERIPARGYVYVADNPAKDFMGPAALGWRTVRIRRNGGLHFGEDSSPPLPDAELPDCSGLVGILERFAGSAT